MGTDSAVQWLGNIGGIVPGVWLTLMETLAGQIVELCLKAIQAYKLSTVQLVGHSRGGDIAGHVAVMLARYTNIHSVITFGSAGMSNLVDASQVADKFYHVMDKNDPVPMVFGAGGQYPGHFVKFTNFREHDTDAHKLENYEKFVHTTMQKGKRTSVRKDSKTAQICSRCQQVWAQCIVFSSLVNFTIACLPSANNEDMEWLLYQLQVGRFETSSTRSCACQH
jgi:hypothetical protein